MKAITLRNVPPELTQILRRRAQESGASMNKTLIAVLQETLVAGVRKAANRSYHDLDHLAGSWTRPQAVAFDRALARQRQIDTDLWK